MLKSILALAAIVITMTGCATFKGGQTTAHTAVKAPGPAIAIHTQTTIKVVGKDTTKTVTIDSTVMTAAGAEHDLKKTEIGGNTKVGVAEAENKNRGYCWGGCGRGVYPGYGDYPYGYGIGAIFSQGGSRQTNQYDRLISRWSPLPPATIPPHN